MERSQQSERYQGTTTTWWYVTGPHGAVQYMLMYVHSIGLYLPMDLGVHSRTPLFEGHEAHPCGVMSGECYFSPSFGRAAELYESYRKDQKPDTIWKELERVYTQVFCAAAAEF